MTTDATLHWLTFTTGDFELLSRCPGWLEERESKAFFRERMVPHETKATRHYNCEHDSTDVVNCTGDVCEGHSGYWASVAAEAGGRISRIDIAVDVDLPDVRREMLKLRRFWFAKKVDTKIQTFEEHRSYREGSGFTWYFGGRESEMRLRVYDRRGPLRLEFQWRPEDREHLLAQIALQHLDLTWRRCAEKIIFPVKWYFDLLKGNSLQFTSPVKSQPSVDRAAMVLQEQYGVTLWALRRLGIEPESLERPPADKRQRAKVRQWLVERAEQGFDVSHLDWSHPLAFHKVHKE